MVEGCPRDRAPRQPAAALAVGAALSLTRLMRGLLFGVAAADVATIAGVAGMVVLVAFAACVVPARRAMAVSPILALRQE
jgi:ABC-type lipoprotein release transport system permease subunit